MANFNLTIDKLKLIAKHINFEDYKNMSKSKLEHLLFKTRQKRLAASFKNDKL